MEEVVQEYFIKKIDQPVSWEQVEVKMEGKAEDLVPKKWHKYLKIFEKKESEQMLTRKPWDHEIQRRLCTQKSQSIPIDTR